MQQKITRKRWTDAEMEFARQLYSFGIPKEEIAERLGRTKKSIEVRISVKREFFEAGDDKPLIINEYVKQPRPSFWERLRRLFA